MRSNAVSPRAGISDSEDNEKSRDIPVIGNLLDTVKIRSGRTQNKSVIHRNSNYMNNTVNKDIKIFTKFDAEPEFSPRFKTPCPRPINLSTRHGHIMSYRDP